MPENFDPYRKWLGIPPDEQPPHHYRLLGIGLFEADADVIQEAADRQMAHVQTHKMGRYSELSQKLLNELAAAKLTLLNADRKAAYDSALRAKQAAAKAAAAPRMAVPLAAASPAAQAVAGQNPARPVQGRSVPPLPPPRPATVVAVPVAAAPRAAEIEEQDFVGAAMPRASRRNGGKHGKKKISPLYMAAGGLIVVMIGVIVVLARGLNNGDSTTSPDKNIASVTPPGTNDPSVKPPPVDSDNPEKQPGSTDTPDTVKKPAVKKPADDDAQPSDTEPTDDPPPGETQVGTPNEVVEPKHVSPEMLGQLPAHPGAISCSALSPNGKRAVTAGREGGLRVWDVDRKQELRQIPLQSDFANAVAFFGDNTRVAVAGHDGYVRIIDTNSGNELQAWGGVRLPVMSVAVTPDGRFVVAGGHEKIVRVWDMATGKEVNRWAGFKDHIYAVGITPDGRRILAASGGYWPSGKLTSAEDHTLHMVDLKTKQESKFTGHKGGIWSISVSGNGQRAASASYDGTVRIWNLLSGTVQHVLDGHPQTGPKPIVWCCAFSLDGRNVLSAGDDAVLRVWDANSGRPIKQLTGATRSITGLGLSADSRIAITSGSENAARLWAIRPGVEVAVKPKPPTDDVPDETPGNTPGDEPGSNNPNNKTPVEDAGPKVSLAELFGEPKLAGDPVPEAADRQQAIKLIKEIFQDDYKAAKKPPEKLALAEKLVEQAGNSQSSVERFALLSEARDRAREAGNSTLIIDIYEKLAGQFAIDPLDEMVKTFDQMQKETAPPATKKELAENLLPLSERAMAAQKYATAHKLLSIAQSAAAKTADKQLPKQIAARDVEVGELRKRFDAAKTAYEALAKNPDDAAASLALGKYLCFDKEDWFDGLPLLAKGSDDALAKLAAQDAANPSGFEEQVKLADAWNAAAESGDAKEKPKVLMRAEKWYQTALPNLPAGLTKAKVEKRLEELASLLPRSSVKEKQPGDAVGSERPATPATTGTTNASLAKSLAARLKQASKKNTLVFSQLAGGTTGNPYQEVPSAGKLLVGFNYTLNEYGNISSLQPIYQSSKDVVAGTMYGYVNGPPQTIVAKKGYAVSAVQVQGSLYMYGLQVDFMKIDKSGLDTKDAYSSEWVGRKYSGYRQLTLGGDGNFVVGAYGKTTSQQVASLGLIQLPPEKAEK